MSILNLYDNTHEYYEENAEHYFKKTIDNNITEGYLRFRKYVPVFSKILDLGCGSGRDSYYFYK